MKRKPTPNPDQLNLLDYQNQVTQLIQETDSDPDYQRLSAVFRDLAKDYDRTRT